MTAPAIKTRETPTAPSGSAAGWDIEVLPRRAAPPLRISARRLFRHCAERAGEPVMSLALHKLRHGGFAVSWSSPDGSPGAVRVDDVDGAMATVEALCGDVRAPSIGAGEPWTTLDDVIAALGRVHRTRRDAEDFLAMAGQALDAWDAWNRAGGPEPDAGDR